jgi:hypothetical protein
MTAALPYTQMYAGLVQATAVHQAAHKWPVYFSGTSGVYVVYDDRIFYDQAITYDGLMLASDVTLTVGATRVAPDVGATQVGRTAVGPVRLGRTVVGPTRWGRRKSRALPTRVIRYTLLQVQPTRVAKDVGTTHRSVLIGPTRVQRGK